MIFVDTWAWVALADRSDPYHRRAKQQHQELVEMRRSYVTGKMQQTYHDKPDISFVEFTSMVVMQDLGITDVFTGDAHFQQVGPGFRLLP